MKKIMALLTALIFAISTPLMAAGTTMSDAEMDEIAAGAWEVIDPETQEVVDGIHYNNNDIDLEDDSQRQIQAVANTNSVDSADAVQSNVTSITGDGTIENSVAQKNEANLTNYNPSESSSYEKTKEFSLTENSFSTSSFELSKNKEFDLLETYTSKYDETLDINEDLLILAAFASVWESENKNEESEGAAAGSFALVYDYVLDYDKHKTKNEKLEINADESFSKKEFSVETSSKTIGKSESKKRESRSSLSENNHINLQDDSQRNMQVVSNLNSVGSAAAAQSNIASNVGVNGTISGINIATASNGF
jgi:hypothetical protein